MDNTYDVIVIGAGRSSLTAALELLKKGKKVLILESSNESGSIAKSIVRGRFEFEVSTEGLWNYGNDEKKGELYQLFLKLGIKDKLDLVTVKDAFCVYEKNSNINYTLPFGIVEFMETIEEYVPNSVSSLKKFFFLAEESKEALEYISKNKSDVDQNYLKRNFPDFLRIANHSVSEVFEAIKMPRKTSEIISSLWIYFGSPTNKLSFVEFASSVYSYLLYKEVIPTKKTQEISLLLIDEIEKNNGMIKYNSKVKEILFKDKKVAGVLDESGNIYEASHIISSVSPTFMYGKMLPLAVIPKNALKLTNSRVLGPRIFKIFLGLNQSPKDLGLDKYHYLIYENLDSNKEYQNMSSIKNASSIVKVLNNAYASSSKKGTTIMEFTTLFMGDAYSRNVTEKNYFDMKNKIAENIINNFEVTTNILIKPYIEEIEILTPIDFAKLNNYPDGAISYKKTGLDNYLPRLISYESENFIEGIRFCGSFSKLKEGFSNSYLFGDFIAKETLKDIEREDN